MKYQAKIAFTSTERTSDFGNVCIPLEGQCKNTKTSQKKRKRIQKIENPHLIINEYHLSIHLSVTRCVPTMGTGQCGSPVQWGAKWDPHSGPGLAVNDKMRMMRVCVGVPFPC